MCGDIFETVAFTIQYEQKISRGHIAKTEYAHEIYFREINVTI